MEEHVRLVALTEKRQIAEALETVSRNWKKDSKELRRNVGWRPVTHAFTIWWRPREKIWAVFQPEAGYHNIYVGLSMDRNTLSIDGQFDVPASGFSRRAGGVFLEDRDAHIYLGHTGSIGGGVPGVGRYGFLEYCKGKTDEIAWSDGKITEGFCIADITSEELPARARWFTELRLGFMESVRQ
jgi:hypothetical protein